MKDGSVPSRERPVYTMRLSNAERRLLEAAAAQRQEYLSEFIRGHAVEAARRELAGAEGKDRDAPR